MAEQITDPKVLNTINESRSKRSDLGETAQALLYEMDRMKRQLAEIATAHSRELHAVVIARGCRNTVGGSPTELFNIPGTRKGMICLAQISEKGSTPVYIEAAQCLHDQVELTFTGDPSNDHKVAFAIFR